MRPWEYLCHHSTQIKAVNRDPGGREESENISLLFLLTMTCVCGDEMVWVHISFFFFVPVCGGRLWETFEKMRKTYQLAVWEISRMPAEPNLPSPPSAWPLYLGKYTPLDARWPEACLLAKQPWLRSGIFSDAARKIDCPPALGGCPQSSCILYYPCQLARLPLHTSSPHRQKCTDAICVLICGLMSTYANLHTRTHEHTHTSDHFQPNELAAPRVHDIHPTTTPIQFPCWWNWIYSIDASKHTGVWGVYYSAADERLHGLYCAIIIVITVIIWPSFGSFNERATFIPGSISVWNDAGMTWGTEQIDLGRQGRNACQFAIKVHALYLPKPD